MLTAVLLCPWCPGELRELLLLTLSSPAPSSVLEPLPESAKTHSSGEGKKMPFWQDSSRR